MVFRCNFASLNIFEDAQLSLVCPKARRHTQNNQERQGLCTILQSKPRLAPENFLVRWCSWPCKGSQPHSLRVGFWNQWQVPRKCNNGITNKAPTHTKPGRFVDAWHSWERSTLHDPRGARIVSVHMLPDRREWGSCLMIHQFNATLSRTPHPKPSNDGRPGDWMG